MDNLSSDKILKRSSRILKQRRRELASLKSLRERLDLELSDDDQEIKEAFERLKEAVGEKADDYLARLQLNQQIEDLEEDLKEAETRLITLQQKALGA